MKRLLLLALLVGTANASEVYKVNGNTSVIINVCIASVADPNVYIHADEDIASLAIEFLDEDGVSLGLYDAGTEIEDVAAPGTGAFTTPSANNVRVSPDGNGAGDCTEIQPPDAIFASDDIVRLRISDGGTTLLDFDEQITLLATEISTRASIQAELEEMKLHKLALSAVTGSDITDNSVLAYLVSDDATADWDSYNNQTDSLEAQSNLIGSPIADIATDLAAVDSAVDANSGDLADILVQVGTAGDGLTAIPGLSAFNPVNTTIATLASQVSFTITAGSTDDNAYNGCSAMITDVSTATQIAYAAVRDYDGGTKRITMAYDPGIFTMAATDLISITCGPVMR